MRKLTLILLLFVQSFVSLSQNEVLIKVISFSDGVKINNEVPTVGLNLSDEKAQITIPVDGYFGIITIDGRALRLTESTSVGDALRIRNKLSATGAVHRSAPEIIMYPSETWDPKKSFLLQDSIFINWDVYSSYKDVVADVSVFRLANMFDDSVFEAKVRANHIVVDVRSIPTSDEIFVVSLECPLKAPLIYTPASRSKKSKPTPPKTKIRSSHLMMIRLDLGRKDPKKFQSIKNDLQKVSSKNDQAYIESALYLLNDLHYDSYFCLYKIVKLNLVTTDPILNAYYKRQLEENKLKP